MKMENWLKRKYPKSYKYLSKNLTEYQKIELKHKKMTVCEFLEDYYSSFETYKQGTLFLTKKTKSYYDDVWDGDFDTHALFKCIDDKMTASGYHYTLFICGKRKYKEIKN